MKKANYIISHLKTKPYLKKLRHIDCYNQLLSLLPKTIRENTRFIYQKNDTLFFVLNHPGIKMELNYKSNLIKSILKKLIDLKPQCIFMKSAQIKAFVTNKIDKKEINESKHRKLRYKENSRGKFKNRAKNREIYDILEKIRSQVKINKSHELN